MTAATSSRSRNSLAIPLPPRQRLISSLGLTPRATRWPKRRDYAPMPKKVGEIEKMWASEMKDSKGNSLHTSSMAY